MTINRLRKENRKILYTYQDILHCIFSKFYPINSNTRKEKLYKYINYTSYLVFFRVDTDEFCLTSLLTLSTPSDTDDCEISTLF